MFFQHKITIYKDLLGTFTMNVMFLKVLNVNMKTF